jgi:hypothetical protein
VNHPPFNPEEVIQRLRDENSQLLKIMDEINLVISSNGKFDGCTTIGGVKAMMKLLHDQREAIFQLEREIQTLKNKR